MRAPIIIEFTSLLSVFSNMFCSQWPFIECVICPGIQLREWKREMCEVDPQAGAGDGKPQLGGERPLRSVQGRERRNFMPALKSGPTSNMLDLVLSPQHVSLSKREKQNGETSGHLFVIVDICNHLSYRLQISHLCNFIWCTKHIPVYIHFFPPLICSRAFGLCLY